MEVHDTHLKGVRLIVPRVFEDDRGFFLETFNSAIFEENGLPVNFVQDNHSHSSRGVLRGLHYQFPTWQGKLVRVVTGEIFDVAVDIRPESPTFAQWYGVVLSEENKHQLYIPPGYAHGFCVLSDTVDVTYKCTALYTPAEDAGIRWDDPDIGIDWPISDPSVSEKDRNAPLLKELVLAQD
ncbi:MAG: dTDP-4-dehydrorhamnose 3,5-epimerase [Gammaproteobacteria bacterium]|nr:MAG: dTDP-4-dehydrorhamnose 3,5-epimerase [Gammaproteobacteria bacterium]